MACLTKSSQIHVHSKTSKLLWLKNSQGQRNLQISKLFEFKASQYFPLRPNEGMSFLKLKGSRSSRKED